MMRAFLHCPLAVCVCLAVSVGAIWPLKAALPGFDELDFAVFRDGEPLGHHRVAFRRDAGDLHVEIDIELEVKLAFLTLFSYRHSNREVWRDGRLVAIDTETDDDGTRHWLRGRASAEGLRVEGSGGTFVAPPEILPTSYWNAETVNRTRFLDTQHGRLIEVEIARGGAETVVVEGQATNAQRYSVSGDLNLDLWYASDGQWAKTRFEARGAEVVYERRQIGGEDAAQSTSDGQ